MRVILVGKPGSGKSTLGRSLASSLHIPYISSGAALREKAVGGSIEAREVADRLRTGRMMSDGFVDDLIQSRLAEADAARGWVLDGYPRRLSEVDAMAGPNSAPQVVLHLKLDDEPALQRIASRAEAEERPEDAESPAARRIVEFRSSTLAVLEAYGDLVVEIDALQTPEDLLADALSAIRHPPRVASDQ